MISWSFGSRLFTPFFFSFRLHPSAGTLFSLPCACALFRLANFTFRLHVFGPVPSASNHIHTHTNQYGTYQQYPIHQPQVQVRFVISFLSSMFFGGSLSINFLPCRIAPFGVCLSGFYTNSGVLYYTPTLVDSNSFAKLGSRLMLF